ncbi:hypothetical protein BMW23_0950 [Bodo saltans virus]|uniref:Uncharacterized protein n=1 Tax=Bodo saltans virus TaxID=2024608 RepID=A0A2H4UVY3_9VIRU|nr:hypothetical protein QJ851_gp0932 [Bodo saltans virus]ATZ80995.1 hypothetical protein BMW23_0950 [Bodo saltans virus]
MHNIWKYTDTTRKLYIKDKMTKVIIEESYYCVKKVDIDARIRRENIEKIKMLRKKSMEKKWK